MQDEEKNIQNLLKEVIDPELGLNIVDLGLIYEIRYLQEGNITVIMTLTTPGCPMAEILPQSVEETIKAQYPQKEVVVEVVWDPAWTPDRINENGKLLLGL